VRRLARQSQEIACVDTGRAERLTHQNVFRFARGVLDNRAANILIPPLSPTDLPLGAEKRRGEKEKRQETGKKSWFHVN
jgi:hypothetical protein